MENLGNTNKWELCDTLSPGEIIGDQELSTQITETFDKIVALPGTRREPITDKGFTTDVRKRLNAEMYEQDTKDGRVNSNHYKKSILELENGERQLCHTYIKGWIIETRTDKFADDTRLGIENRQTNERIRLYKTNVGWLTNENTLSKASLAEFKNTFDRIHPAILEE